MQCSAQLLRISRPPGSHRGCLPPSPRASQGAGRERPEPVPSSGRRLRPAVSFLEANLPRLATRCLRPSVLPAILRSPCLFYGFWCLAPTTSGPCLAPPEFGNVVACRHHELLCLVLVWFRECRVWAGHALEFTRLEHEQPCLDLNVSQVLCIPSSATMLIRYADLEKK